MSYAKAVTMIEDLPPMVQVKPPCTGYPYSRNHMENSADESMLPNDGTDPYGYYDEVVDKIPSISRKIRQYDKNSVYDEYQRKNTMPATPRNDYGNGNMIPRYEVNHLPITPTDPTIQYANRVHNQYPVVESFNLIPCRDIMSHIDNCPICKKIFKKNDLLLFCIIAILAVVIILFLLQNKTY